MQFKKYRRKEQGEALKACCAHKIRSIHILSFANSLKNSRSSGLIKTDWGIQIVALDFGELKIK